MSRTYRVFVAFVLAATIVAAVAFVGMFAGYSNVARHNYAEMLDAE